MIFRFLLEDEFFARDGNLHQRCMKRGTKYIGKNVSVGSVIKELSGGGRRIAGTMFCCNVMMTSLRGYSGSTFSYRSWVTGASGSFLHAILLHVRNEKRFEETLERSFVTRPW